MALSYQDKQGLLEKHNPILILLPRDPSRKRPGALWQGDGRGDYHPCSAGFFLSQVKLHRQRRSWQPLKGGGVEAPTAPGLLQTKVANSEGQTHVWELNLAGIKSDDPSQAWDTYGNVLLANAPPNDCVTYARAEAVDDRIYLQYWYLYLYNDAPNTHEGDWETVTIELDAAKEARQVAYAGHEGGARRIWEGVTHKGDRPLVFVARGSHAAYLEHMPVGHKTAHMNFDKNLPEPLKTMVATVQGFLARAFFFAGIRDYTSSLRLEDYPNQGTEVSPRVLLMPEAAHLDSRDWWWMNLHGRWGSSRARVTEFVAPYPPWTKGEKWLTPLIWLDKQNAR